MIRFVKSLLAATAFGVAAAGCASYDYGYGYSQPYAYSYGDGYPADYGPYYDYGPGYYVGPPALGFYYYDYDNGRDHHNDWRGGDRGDHGGWHRGSNEQPPAHAGEHSRAANDFLPGSARDPERPAPSAVNQGR